MAQQQENQAAATAAHQAQGSDNKLIFATSYLSEINSAEVLHTHWHRAMKRRRDAGSAYTSAMWDGYYFTRDEAMRSLKEAVKRGQLLFCWAGSSVGGAA